MIRSMIPWGGPLSFHNVTVGPSQALVFGHIEGTPADPELGSRIAPAMIEELSITDLTQAWLLGSLAAGVTVKLASSPGVAGTEGWSLVVGGCTLAGQPPTMWTHNEQRARGADLALARMEAESDDPYMADALARREPEALAEMARRDAASVHLSVEQYASLCAERRARPQAVAEIARRYAFGSPSAIEAEDAEWRQRFEGAPALRPRFQHAHDHWLAWLQRQG
jgi:hypothetical protein